MYAWWKEDWGDFIEYVGIKRNDKVRLPVEVKVFSRQKIQAEWQGKVSPHPVKESAWGESGDIKNHKGKTVEGGMFIEAFWWGLHLTFKGFQTRFE